MRGVDHETGRLVEHQRLVGALHRLKSENREMVLVNPRERIASLLRVAKLDSLFSIYESVPEAIAAITRREEDTGVN